MKNQGWAAAPLLALLLTACGGGGGSDDDATAGDDTSTVPASACLPTQAGFEAVTMGASYSAAVTAVGCEGELLNEIVVEGVAQKTYAWGRVDSGPYLQMQFRSGALHAKTAQRLSGRTERSACLPTLATYQALDAGASYADAAAGIGCEGMLLNEIVVGGQHQKNYAWGDVASGPYAQVKFVADALDAKLSQRLTDDAVPSACLPSTTSFAALVIGMSYPAAVDAVGCDGQLLNDLTTDGVNQRSYAWGHVASGPYAQVQFRDGLLSAKTSQRLDDAGAPSSCLPTQSGFDALVPGISAAAAATTLGCAGQLLNEVVVDGAQQTTYAWGSVVSGPYIQVTFRGGSLHEKFAQRLGGSGAPSSCLPTQGGFDSLVPGMSDAAAAGTIGCGGQLLNEIVLSDGSHHKTYAWGNVVSGPYVQVKFVDGVLTTKYGTRLE